jgi:TonB family protein
MEERPYLWDGGGHRQIESGKWMPENPPSPKHEYPIPQVPNIGKPNKPAGRWTFRIPLAAWFILVPWILIWCVFAVWVSLWAGLLNAAVLGRLSAYLIVLIVPYAITWLLWLLFRRSQKIASIAFVSMLLIMAVAMFGPELAEIGRQARKNETHDQLPRPADIVQWKRTFGELVTPKIRTLARSLKDSIADGKTPSDRTIVDLKLTRNGKLIEAKISQSSGVESLDAAVLQMVTDQQYFPRPSPDMPGDPVSLKLPVDFRTK